MSLKNRKLFPFTSWFSLVKSTPTNEALLGKLKLLIDSWRFHAKFAPYKICRQSRFRQLGGNKSLI